MDSLERAAALLPESMRRQAAERCGRAEELRLRVGRRPTALIDGVEREFGGPEVTGDDLRAVLERATGASLHTAAQALAQGYLSCGGLRIGVCGVAAVQEGRITGFRAFSSLAIRIPRQCRGVCDALTDRLYAAGFESTLVISPPGGGKTTALREIVRRLSDAGTRVAVVDERNELSATENGRPRFDLGRDSDVLVGVGKAEGAMLLLRTMNPQVIAMDEISGKEDIDAAAQICGCAVGLLASAHASSAEELRMRPLYRMLLELGLFRNLVVISGTGDMRRYRTERIEP